MDPRANPVAVIWVMAQLTIAFSLSGADWPQFLGPQANGISAETGLIERFGAAGPKKAWSLKIGTGYSAPSVIGNKLVLHHRVGEEEIVECYDAATGKSLWSHRTPTTYQDPYGYNNGPRCTPLLTTNRCYTYGAEGRLVCVDLVAGKLVWQRETAKEFEIPAAFFGVGSTPILEGNRLLVMIGGQPNAGMIALDPATGKTLWQSVGEKNWTGVLMTGWPGERTVAWRAWEKQASYATPVAATVHGFRRVFCLMRQGLVCLDPATGLVDDSYWFRARVDDSVNAANPIVLGNEVFISAAYFKVGSVWLDLRRQESRLKFEAKRKDLVLEVHWTTPILHQGYLYAFSGRNEPDARFRCVNFATGALMWERDESWRHGSNRQPPVYGRGSAIAADGRLIVLGEGGLLGMFRLDPNHAAELCRWQVPELMYPTWAAPVLSAKKLYLRGEQALVCLDLAPAQ